MNNWSKSYGRDIEATPHAIWAVLADTSTWNLWNAGVKSIQIDGDFVAGTHFTMELPDGDVIKSKLISVVERQHFIDESRLGETVVQVEHRIEVLRENKSRVTYTIRVQGPESQVIGEAVSEDFPLVIEGLGQFIANH
ncbi:MAG: SRPBCC family protein [Comamonas sp.]